MQPPLEVFNVVENVGASGLRKKTLVGRYIDSRISETNVEKPLAIRSIISTSHNLKKKQRLKGA